jgi:glutathione S-transferase
MVGAVTAKLHCCSLGWIKLQGHACWRVEQALIDSGVDYDRATHPVNRRKRDAMIELSGQKLYPVLELEDGSVYREESKAMAETIRAGKLDEHRSPTAS